METTYRKMTVESLKEGNWPIDPIVIPNCMGINLCSVDGMAWTRKSDGQLVSLSIHFIPEGE